MDRSQTNRNTKGTLMATDRQKANEMNKTANAVVIEQEHPVTGNTRGNSVLKRYMSNFNQTTQNTTNIASSNYTNL